MTRMWQRLIFVIELHRVPGQSWASVLWPWLAENNQVELVPIQIINPDEFL